MKKPLERGTEAQNTVWLDLKPMKSADHARLQ
jgi:hypothetical protein